MQDSEVEKCKRQFCWPRVDAVLFKKDEPWIIEED